MSIKPFFAAASALVLLAAGTPAPTVRAGSITLTGDTTGAPTFNRPTETGALSFFESVPYNAVQFSVTQDGTYHFTLAAADPSEFDTFLHLYRGGFDPAAPDNAFFLAANDDASGGATTDSALTAVSLLASGTYFLVLDGFSNADFGAYTATISGPGNISATVVPEPSAARLLMITGAASAFGFFAHRRRMATRS